MMFEAVGLRKDVVEQINFGLKMKSLESHFGRSHRIQKNADIFIVKNKYTSITFTLIVTQTK